MIFPVRLDRIWVGKEKKWQLRDVSFNVSKGERLLVVGHNGAGKSTLIHVIAGLIHPVRGSMSWNGTVLDRSGRKVMAMVFQQPRLLKRTVAQVLRHSVSMLKLTHDERERRLEEALSSGKLVEQRNQPVNSLSGGETRLLAFARALMRRPELLLLDEPFAHLDSDRGLHVFKLIKCFRRVKDTGLVMVSHGGGEVLSLVDRVIVLEYGSLVYDGPPSKIAESSVFQRYIKHQSGLSFQSGTE